MATEELAPAAGPGLRASIEIEPGHAVRELGIPGIAREHGTALHGLGDDERRLPRAAEAERPFGIRHDGEAALAARAVAQSQHAPLDRLDGIDEHQQLRFDALDLDLEAAVALAVRDVVTRIGATHGLCAGAPDVAAVLVAQVQRLARGIDDRIVGPGRQQVLAAVLRPGEGTAGFGHEGAEAGVRDDVAPGQWRATLAVQLDHVLAAAVGETAEAVRELERRGGDRDDRPG